MNRRRVEPSRSPQINDRTYPCTFLEKFFIIFWEKRGKNIFASTNIFCLFLSWWLLRACGKSVLGGNDGRIVTSSFVCPLLDRCINPNRRTVGQHALDVAIMQRNTGFRVMANSRYCICCQDGNLRCSIIWNSIALYCYCYPSHTTINRDYLCCAYSI